MNQVIRKFAGLCLVTGISIATLAIEANAQSSRTITSTRTNAKSSGAFCSMPDANFCKGNVFTNGNFEDLNGYPKGAQFIDKANGWSQVWQGTSGQEGVSLADLYCPTAGSIGGVYPPSPALGVYAAMWITNRNIGADLNYREGMFNKLQSTIAKSSGGYTFNFKTSVAQNLSGKPVKVGLYGVNYNTSSPLPASPAGVSTPNNLNLFGAGKAVLLATVTLPANATTTWVNQTVTFDSSMAGFPSSGVTHIMVTKSDEVTGGIAYVTFDDFCLQLTSPSNWNPGDVVSTPIGNPRPDPQEVAGLSTCCPPLNGGANGQMPNFFNATAHQANGDYNMQFSTSSPQYAQFASGYQAYIGLLGATSGGSINKLDVGWYLYEVMPDGSWGPLLETIYSSFKVSTPIVAPTGFTTLLKPNHKYVIKAYTYSWDGRQAGEYGFQESCNSGDQFAFQWGISNGRSKKPGLAISPVTGTPGSKPVLPAR